MIQYPKLEHVTLPSVESWGTNNNIIKDPPKSLFTRRIDKVGQTQMINEEVDGSGDRICEGINVYARGVNPFTAVEYSNNSNNAGIKGSITNISSNSQASLPYKVMREGVFRPPVQNPRDLLPLSRQPRLLTSQLANPGFVNFSKGRACPDKFRQIKPEVLQTCARPTAVFNLEKPIEPFSVNYSIVDNPIQYSVSAGYQAKGNTQIEYQKPIKGANNENNNVMANTNYGIEGRTKRVNFEINEDKYIKEALQGSYNTNFKGTTFINGEIGIQEDRYIKDILEGSYSTNYKGANEVNGDFEIEKDRYIRDGFYTDYVTPLSGNEKYNILSDEIFLESKLPSYQAYTNYSDSRVNKTMEYENEIYLERNTPLTSARSNISQINNPANMNSGSRDFKLPQTLQKGGFEGKGTMPLTDRNYEGESLNDTRKKFNDKVNSYFEGRYQVGKPNFN
jgi:hypothetical protein